MTALEQGERQFKNTSFTAVECEFFSAFWHWAGSVEPLLNYQGHRPLSSEQQPKRHKQDRSHTSMVCGPPLRNYKRDRSGGGCAGLTLGSVAEAHTWRTNSHNGQETEHLVLSDSQSWFCSVVGIAGDEFWHTVGILFCSWTWFRDRTGMLSFTSQNPVYRD
jgi:hypothetical protein